MLDKIKSLFFVEENDPKSLKTKEKTITKNIQKNKNTPPASGGKVTPKFSEILMNAMAKKNLEGFDYLEFKESLQSLSKMQMDESTRYKSAFAMAKTMNLTKNKLQDSAKYYLNVLENEHSKFYEALKNQKQRLIQDNVNKEKQIAAAITENEKRIKALQKEIEELKKQQSEIKQVINQSTQKVNITEQNFGASYRSVVDKIKADLDKINKYL